MVEENNLCCICSREVHGRVGYVPVYYCSTCFSEYRDDIIAKASWVSYLLKQEKQRRKRRNRLLAANRLLRFLYLGGAYGRY